MKFFLFYPADEEQAARQIRARLSRISSLQLTLIAATCESYAEDLDDACSTDGPLILLLSPDLIPKGQPARATYSPLLKRLEAHAPTAILTQGEIQLPPLLAKQLLATWSPSALRPIEAWALSRLPHQLDLLAPIPPAPQDPQLIESLMVQLIDNASTVEHSRPLDAHQFAALARPHFEAIHILDAHHQSTTLSDAVITLIQPAGRVLWILNGYTGPTIDAPLHASILILPDAELAAALDPYSLLRETPTREGKPLPFSTHEFEQTLPSLFESNWPLAESIAKKAGTFFKVNNRVSEAIWIYDLLGRASRTKECTAECEYELSWLHAGGKRKSHLLDASQASFNFGA